MTPVLWSALGLVWLLLGFFSAYVFYVLDSIIMFTHDVPRSAKWLYAAIVVGGPLFALYACIRCLTQKG